MLSIQSENESMRGYSQSLVDLHEVQAGLQAEAAASLNADAQNTVRTVILAMVLTGLLGLGLAVLLTRRITRPVRALTRAAQNLSKGKLGHRVEIRGKNELARLGRAFNHMASSLQLQHYALLNDQSKLRSVHQSIADGILVFGNNGFIISANPAAEATINQEEAMLAGSRTTGIMELDEILARPELIGPADMIACWEYNKCRQDECPSYMSEDLRCWLQCGTYCHNEIQDSFTQKRDACERCPVYHANGCVTVDAEADGRSYSISVAPILDDQGRPEGWLAVLHDMTDERHRSLQLGLLLKFPIL